MSDDYSIVALWEQIGKELAEKGCTKRNPKEIIGEQLQEFRKKRKMSIEQVAKESGFSEGTISNYENGKTVPTLDDLRILLFTYDVTLYDFFGIEKADYENDYNIFKRYGLNVTFYRELVLAKKYRIHNDIVNCLNLIFEYPMYAFTLFEELTRFFNPANHEQIEKLLVELPFNGANRVLLEPVIHTLGNIYNAKYLDRQKNALISLLGQQADAQAEVQARLFEAAEQSKE